MTIRRLITWITFLAVFAMAARISVDTDTWWHLRAGQWIVEHRQIPRIDTFSYTRFGESWEYPGWIVEVPMYWIYRLLGLGGLNLWTATMVVIAFVFVWLTMSGDAFLRAFILVLAAAASGVYWAARPYLVTFVLTGAYLWLLEGYRWNKWKGNGLRLVWLPFLMALWVNSHGGFIIGFILWGIYWTAEVGQKLLEKVRAPGVPFALVNLRTPLLWAGIGLVLAVCINPYGISMLAYPFKTVSIGALREYIQEWQSPPFHSISFQPFAWLIFLTLGAVGISQRRISIVDFVLVTLFAYLGLLAGRNVALFSIMAPMVITRHASPLFDAWMHKRGTREAGEISSKVAKAFNTVILAVLLVVVGVKAGMAYPEQTNQQSLRKVVPIDAVEFLKREHPPGRIFNSYNWGGYLLWALPEYPVFVDGRTDLYNDEIVSKWLQVVRAENGWQDVLDAYQVHLVLIERLSTLERVLSRESGWQLIYEDTIAVIYQKK